MKYCVIGMGFIFSRHKKCIEESGGELLLTCDIDKSKNSDFLDYKEMYKSDKFKDVDAVVICTPNHLHAPMVREALALGKKVICEKPLVIDTDFTGLEGVFSVLQLRYHDFIEDIKKELKELNKIKLIMKVCRDKKWWDSWRGDESKSGGILFGLAVHMFDFLIFLLGNKYMVISSEKSREKCTGVIILGKSRIEYHVEVLDNDNKAEQTRSFIINGKEFELCNKDNLSFAGYHDRIYEEFLKGNGIPLSEAKKSIELISEL